MSYSQRNRIVKIMTVMTQGFDAV